MVMCGFSGFFTNKVMGLSQSILRSMGEKISHRGPDAEGIWFDAEVGMVHRRLSIIDRSSAGAQPMISPCQNYVISFNGEIYNHLELRSALEKDGVCHVWKGHSDTETLLVCFEAWGVEKTLRSAVGMFAVALWDRERKLLTLARDRLGEKPLYWGWQNGVLLFGSELKSLKAHPSFSGVIDRNSLALLLRHNYIPAPYSIYSGINKLPPANYIQFSPGSEPGNENMKCYWDVNAIIEGGQDNLLGFEDADAISALGDVLSNSVAGQMLADVPLGAFLSGGIDSSLIVALMQQQSSQPIRTFTIGFNEPGFNEAEHAKNVASHLKTDHTEYYVGAAEALDVIPRLAQIYCEPFADSSQIPTFLVSKLAKQYVTVALSGDAGDELFGGYNPYQFAPRVWKNIATVPFNVRSVVSKFSNKLPLPNKVHKLLDILDAPTRESFYQKLLSHWHYPNDVVIGAIEPYTLFNQPEAWPKVDSFEHWMMAVDSQTYMTDDILVKVDRAAMANSLETRVPLLDHRVVEFAWRLPLSMKIRDGKGKWILRELLYRHVPRELIERPKKGFSIPLGSWLKGPLREWAESLLDPALLVQQGYFHPGPIRKLWQQHLTGKCDRSRQLWSILMFQAWLQEQ